MMIISIQELNGELNIAPMSQQISHQVQQPQSELKADNTKDLDL